MDGGLNKFLKMFLKVFCDVCFSLSKCQNAKYFFSKDRKKKLNTNVAINIHHLNSRSTCKLERYVITMVC